MSNTLNLFLNIYVWICAMRWNGIKYNIVWMKWNKIWWNPFYLFLYFMFHSIWSVCNKMWHFEQNIQTMKWDLYFISFHFILLRYVIFHFAQLCSSIQSVMNLVVNKVWKAHESTDLEQKSVMLLDSCQSPFLRQQRYLVLFVLSWSPTHDYERQILHLGCPISF